MIIRSYYVQCHDIVCISIYAVNGVIINVENLAMRVPGPGCPRVPCKLSRCSVMLVCSNGNTGQGVGTAAVLSIAGGSAIMQTDHDHDIDILKLRRLH